MTGFYFKHGLIVTQGQFKEKHFLEVNVVSEFIPPNSLKKEMENSPFGYFQNGCLLNFRVKLLLKSLSELLDRADLQFLILNLILSASLFVI